MEETKNCAPEIAWCLLCGDFFYSKSFNALSLPTYARTKWKTKKHNQDKPEMTWNFDLADALLDDEPGIKWDLKPANLLLSNDDAHAPLSKGDYLLEEEQLFEHY